MHREQCQPQGSHGLYTYRQPSELGVEAAITRRAGGILIGHETDALVKDVVWPKSNPKPVGNYKISAHFDSLRDRGWVTGEEQNGLRIFLDLQKLNKARAAEALKGILTPLES